MPQPAKSNLAVYGCRDAAINRFAINRALKRVFLLHETELLQFAQNKNKDYTSGTPA